MLRLEPFAVRTAPVRSASRHLHSPDEREGRPLTFGKPILGEDAQVADAEHVAELFDAIMGTLPQIVPPDVRELRRHRQVVRHSVGKPERGVEVVLRVVRANFARCECLQLDVGPLLRFGVGQPETRCPMPAVERVGPEHGHPPARPETARTHVVGKRGTGGADQCEERQLSGHPRAYGQTAAPPQWVC
jgi:hypothetical protein